MTSGGYAQASSALSARRSGSGFSAAINIVRYGIEGAAHHAEVGLHEGGYPVLASPAGGACCAPNHALQRTEAVDVALLPPEDLTQAFCFPTKAGPRFARPVGRRLFDGFSLLQAWRAGRRLRGARYVQAEAVGFEHEKTHFALLRIRCIQLSNGEHLEADVVVQRPPAPGRAGWRPGPASTCRCARAASPYPRELPHAAARSCPLLIGAFGIGCGREGQLHHRPRRRGAGLRLTCRWTSPGSLPHARTRTRTGFRLAHLAARASRPSEGHCGWDALGRLLLR